MFLSRVQNNRVKLFIGLRVCLSLPSTKFNTFAVEKNENVKSSWEKKKKFNDWEKQGSVTQIFY